MMMQDRSTWDEQLDLAIATRKEEDLEPLVVAIYSNIVLNKRIELIEDAICQIADDWELEVSKVRGWFEKAGKDETMSLFAELFRRSGISQAIIAA